MPSVPPPGQPGGPGPLRPNGGQKPKPADTQARQIRATQPAPTTKTPPPKTQTKEGRLAKAETKKLKTLLTDLTERYKLKVEYTYGLDNAISDHTNRMRIGEITIEEFNAGQSGPKKPKGSPEFLPQASKAFLDVASALDKIAIGKGRGLQIVIKLIKEYGPPLTNLLEEPTLVQWILSLGKATTKLKTFT